MTTDTTSVDALRTRLARAFEVAALRDPSAELAAFEAAVRREQGERIAKDHEASAKSLPNTIERRTYQTAADRVRMLSPPP